MLFYKKLLSNPLYPKFKSWSILIGVTGSAQVLIQIIGLVSGIMIIRVLPTTEYAFYTIANTMLGTMVLLANGGISTGVMAQSRMVWQDKDKLGEVVATGFDLRRKFSIISLIVSLPILTYLLHKNDASWLTIVFIIVAIIPAFMSTLSNSLLTVVPSLHQVIIPLQKNQIGVNVWRLVFLCLFIFIFPIAYMAILASGLSQIIGNLKLKKIASEHINIDAKPSPIVRKNILNTVKRIFPEAVYYSFSGQITIWILSVFGTTTSLAQIGALGRIAILLTVISTVFKMLITPRFVRLKDDFMLLLKKFFSIILLMFFVFTVVTIITYLIPSQLLWILGPKYANLEKEIVLVVMGASLTTFAGLIYSLYSGKGWIQHPVMSISISLLTLVIGVWVVDVSTLQGVLKLNIIIGVGQLLTHGIYGLYNIFKLRKKQNIRIL